MEIVDWSQYRKQVGDLIWRMSTQEDIPAMLALLDTKQRFLRKQGILLEGETVDRPLLFSRPTLIALVAEDSTGKIVDGLYAEATVDITKMSCRQDGFESIAEIANDLSCWLKSRGFRLASVVVPKSLAMKMSSTLRRMGFRSSHHRSVHWFKWL